MSDLVTLAEVKAHLRLAPDFVDEDADLTLKLQAAQAVVLSHLTQRDEGAFVAIRDAWTEADVPLPVKFAILLQVGELYQFRGDSASEDRARGGLAPAVESLLMPFKDPGVA